MKLELIREIFTDKSTVGRLSVNGVFSCYSLEDPVREEKIAGQTAIPYGTYEVIINYSQRFKKPMPLLLNVPNFEGIRIHPGNVAADTAGCILVGQTKSEDFVGVSKLAFGLLLDDLKSAALIEKIHIEIQKG